MHGILTIGKRHPELELYDSIPPSKANCDDRFNQVVIHGRSMGSSLTLLTNVEMGSSRIHGDDYADVRRQIMVGTVLVGRSHPQSEDDCRFNRASL